MDTGRAIRPLQTSMSLHLVSNIKRQWLDQVLQNKAALVGTVHNTRYLLFISQFYITRKPHFTVINTFIMILHKLNISASTALSLLCSIPGFVLNYSAVPPINTYPHVVGFTSCGDSPRGYRAKF